MGAVSEEINLGAVRESVREKDVEIWLWEWCNGSILCQRKYSS